MKRERLDTSLIRGGHARSVDDAFILVTEGRVFVNGQRAVSPSQPVKSDDEIEIRKEAAHVGRGAVKLQAALDSFGIDPTRKICADIGAATGGFTEVLLERGAKKVFAIDAGRGKLALKLREDSRVVVMEETNVLSLAGLPDPIDLATIDLSFTSLRLVLPKIRKWFSEDLGFQDASTLRDRAKLKQGSSVVALFKPQYEIKDKSLLEHGILQDERVRVELVEAFRSWLRENNWRELGMIESPIRGGEGNIEYLFWLQRA